ncbi:MAG TPA: response regulator [Fimbriimonadaceae bacterium]|nr:response regulator [Fimbriimonadaceae bacterium]
MENDKVLPEEGEVAGVAMANRLAPSPRAANRRILIVDDSPDNRFVFSNVLKIAGFQHIEEVADSRAAVETFRRFQPDLILLDLRMPNLDGFDVLRLLRAETSVPIVITSADNSDETQGKAFELGATALFQSFDMNELISIACRLLDARES